MPSSGAPCCVVDDDPLDNDVAFTCRFTAGLRHVESHMIESPLLNDELACHLAGTTAILLAQRELETLSAQQGAGKHLRVPARSRLLDDALQSSVAKVLASAASGTCNVVALGAGMDTRPWRLKHNSFLSTVNWYDVDFPVITELKCKLLHRAHAQTDRTDSQTPATPSSSTPSCDAGASAAPPPNPNSPELLSGPAHPGSMSVMQDTAACSAADSNTVHAHTVQASSISFPLQTASWTAVPLDLADDSLSAALLAAGLNPFIPTIWLAEAVLYYMPIEQAAAVLRAAAALSKPHSMLLATCVDAELLQASRNLQAGHVFANLFLFDIEDLLENGLGQQWVVEQTPETTKALAARVLGADCYVAAYGGAECLFTAVLKSD